MSDDFLSRDGFQIKNGAVGDFLMLSLVLSYTFIIHMPGGFCTGDAFRVVLMLYVGVVNVILYEKDCVLLKIYIFLFDLEFVDDLKI